MGIKTNVRYRLLEFRYTLPICYLCTGYISELEGCSFYLILVSYMYYDSLVN